MLKHRILNHRNIYLAGLILLAVSLPLSLFGLSLSVFILAINWLLEGQWKRKLSVLRERKSILIFMSFWLMHIIWFINTNNYTYGFHDLKIKLPLFFLPLIIGTTVPLEQKELKRNLAFFVLAVFISTLISMGVLSGMGGYQIRDIREISIFVSHIRLSLYIVIALFFILLNLLNPDPGEKVFLKFIKILLLLWFVLFLFILQSLTGLVVLGVIGAGFGLYLIFSLPASRKKTIVITFLTIGFLLVAGTLIRYFQRFYSVEDINTEQLEKYTANGNPYTHDLTDKHVENGHYLWIYVNEDELRKEWNERSAIDFDTRDQSGQRMKTTIIRYLSSKGIRKDSAGLASLSAEEIKFIEEGVANYLFVNERSMYPFFYKLLWQFEEQRLGSNPTGHSIIQRMIHFKAGLSILKENFWFGVGTGDVPDAFAEYYERTDSLLALDVRHRAHNQFVTLFLTFGIFGFLWAVFALFYPVFKENGLRNPYFVIFITVSVFSLLTEDLFETSAAAMSFAFFYSLFLFGSDNGQQDKIY
jgi:hypothetical protein